jgi:hypothetical protein
VAGELDHRALEPEADPQERHPVLPGEPDGIDLPLHTPDTEPAGDQDAVGVPERLLRRVASEVVGRDPVDLHLHAVMDPAVVQGLRHRQVGVAEVHVLAHDRDPDGIGGRTDPGDEVLPFGEIGLALDPEVTRELVVQPFLMQRQRDLVDRPRVGRADHAADRHVAEQRDLLLQVPANRAVAPTHDRIGLESEGAELLHGVLRRLGLDLAGRSDERHQGDVHERAAVPADLVPELPDGLEEREGFDVADGPADLDDLDVRLLGLGERADPLLDLVRDVGDHLDRLAEVVSPALLGEDARVHGAGGEVRAPMEVLIEEPLVMAEVEVRLRAVVEHEDLAVLERVHRAGIHVDVRIQLLDDDLLTSSFEEATERGGGDALAEP